MSKVLIFVVVLAVPIIGGSIGEKKTVIATIIDNLWTEKCKNVSGVDIDVERNDRIYLEFENCKTNAMNEDEYLEDYEASFPFLKSGSPANYTFSNQLKADIVAFAEKYCPKQDAFLKCTEIKLPIQKDCYTAEELKGQKVTAEVKQRINDFFCKNGTDAVTSFLDGKVGECGMEKKDPLYACYEEYALAPLKDNSSDPIFGIFQKADKLCNSIETLKRCAVPLFQQCELSQTAATLVESFFTYVQTKTTCAEFINVV